MRRGSPWSHIVVGAGAAGCLLAARLSQDPAKRVLLLEAGGRGVDPTIRVPMMTARLMRARRHNWRYVTAPVPGLGGRVSAWPRGRVLGGSTAINGMVYARGLAHDYDLWAQSGLADWSWERVRPHFLTSEQFLGPGGLPEHHGERGELGIGRRQVPVSPLGEAFVEAGRQAGHPPCADFNAPAPEGFGYYHFTIRGGRRESARVFLAAAAGRSNLDIRPRSRACRVVFEGGRARAVEVARRGRRQRLDAEAEIILAAGAIGSPQLLLLSGIGPADQLRGLGIEVVADAPEVGCNLQDHVLVRVQHRIRDPSDDPTLHRLARLDRAVLAFLQAWLLRSGPMTVFPLEAGAYLRSHGAELPDLQCHFLPALSTAAVVRQPLGHASADPGPGFMANVGVMRPASRGFLRLISADPAEPPAIQPNYLDDPRDVELLIEAVGMLREVFAQPAFDRWRGAELSPGADLHGRRDLERWVRQTADTVYHPVGTCRMGADPTSGVDPELRVRQVRGLRVVDASIFPTIPSTNTAAATFMVAEKAATLLR